MFDKLQDFFLQKDEPVRSCLLALRDIILRFDEKMTETVKYGMPCYCFNGKIFCYLWLDKKSDDPYILMVEGNQIDHASLVQGSRARMKILPVDPSKDIPIETIDTIFKMAARLYN